ncbi:MAG: cysteine desulfurase family protein [Acidimicrobiaceae bacterium]|nr:cysteine desulfurase [Acidimicrobiia bacterium]MCY4493299.1 cysteine desulfurase family protein [Acidimicrobiaceae bacterium]
MRGIVNEVYLDYNGSSPIDPRVVEAMLPLLYDGVGNASSAHRFGRSQAGAADQARERIAALVGGAASNVVLTAGATEANNLVLRGAVDAAPADRPRILVSAVEHASVSRTAQWLDHHGLAAVDVIPVSDGGFVDPDTLAALLGPDVLLVSVMAANSETGVLNSVAEISRRAHAVGALFHCDATQAAGRLAIDLAGMGADFVSLSSHKICGPGGVGALVGSGRSLRSLRPLIHGGGHERNLRSGSLNVAGAVGFGEACRIALDERAAEFVRVGLLRDRLAAELKHRIPAVCENGDVSRRIPNTANVRFEGADAEAVVANMDPVAVSTGSACSSGSIEPSAVLLAMGLSRDAAYESVRFSLGRFTTDSDIDAAVDAAVTAVEYVRAMNRESR